MLGPYCCQRVSLVAESGGYSPVVHGLLIVVASQGHVGSVVVVHRLNCPSVRGIFPDLGSNMCSVHWQIDSPPLDHQGSC